MVSCNQYIVLFFIQENGKTLVVHAAYQNFLLTSTNMWVIIIKCNSQFYDACYNFVWPCTIRNDDGSTVLPVSLILSSTVTSAESESVTSTLTMDGDPVILTFNFASAVSY